MVYKEASGINSIKERVLAAFLNIYDALFIPRTNRGNQNEKWLLVVKLDLIGDYVLVRNFIEQLKNSPKYTGYKVAFCCNAGVLELSKSLDAGFIDEWIPLKLKPFQKKLDYRKQVATRLKKRQYEVAIFPTQSRSFFHDDHVAKLANAKLKIAAKGNSYNQLPWQAKITSQFYDQIIDCNWNYDFELHLNQRFFERIESEVKVEFPQIETDQKGNRNRILISPGASADFRRWSTKNFTELIDHIIHQEAEAEILISGAPSEMELCQNIKDNFKANEKVLNLCGKLTLSQLVNELATCQLVVSNESGVTHLAKAVGVSYVYCISNANHYKRFNPYPIDNSETSMRYFYPPEFLAQLHENEKATIEKYYWGSHINIQSVLPKSLIDAFDNDRLSIFSN